MSQAFRIDPVALTGDLIRCPSITPEDNGALATLEKALTRLGFHLPPSSVSGRGTPKVENLLALIGAGGAAISASPGIATSCRPGNLAGWTVDPFGGSLIDGAIYGRGANDMKGALAAIVAAAARHLRGAAASQQVASAS